MSASPVPGLQIHVTMVGFSHGCWGLNLTPCTYAPSTSQTEHLPAPALSLQQCTCLHPLSLSAAAFSPLGVTLLIQILPVMCGESTVSGFLSALTCHFWILNLGLESSFNLLPFFTLVLYSIGLGTCHFVSSLVLM